jgi:very-short-patch-repair endonuclease
MADDRAVVRVAATQMRVIRADQLAAAGMTWNAIAHRLERGLMRRLWHGVYILGPDAPSYRTLARAGVLTCKDEAAVSCEWAGYFWGLRPEPQLPVEVTRKAGSHRGRKKKVLVHRTILTDRRDYTTRLGLPITTPERTILDLAETLSQYELEALIADAMVRKLVTVHALKSLINRTGRHRGVSKLKRALEESPGLTRSQYERLLRHICREGDLPQPRTNYPLHGYEVDFFFPLPDGGVVIEVNPFSTHGHRKAHNKDTHKLTDLAARGYVVLGFTDDDLTNRPLYVVAKIAEALKAQNSSSITAGEFVRRASASMPFAGSGREK